MINIYNILVTIYVWIDDVMITINVSWNEMIRIVISRIDSSSILCIYVKLIDD